MSVESARATAHQRLRALFRVRAWHPETEVVRAGGLRYRTRLAELRRGLDGRPPLEIQRKRRPHGRVSQVFIKAREAAE